MQFKTLIFSALSAVALVQAVAIPQEAPTSGDKPYDTCLAEAINFIKSGNAITASDTSFAAAKCGKCLVLAQGKCFGAWAVDQANKKVGENCYDDYMKTCKNTFATPEAAVPAQ